jgi:hypothetical protein
MKRFKEYIKESIKTEYYYIASGAKNAQYTLRRVWEEERCYEVNNIEVITPQQFDEYVCNLGTKQQSAVAKARKMIEQLREQGIDAKLVDGSAGALSPYRKRKSE